MPEGGSTGNWETKSPQSPATGWNLSQIVIKQEPPDEERNDSGVASSGSDIQSSPGSEHGQDSTAQNLQRPTGQTPPYFPTPLVSRMLANFGNIPTHSRQSNQQNPPGPSQNVLTAPPLQNKEEGIDPLSCLQISMERKGLLPRRSPKSSETSTDGDNNNYQDLEDYDDQDVRLPKINSHGKMKTFKCKQCDFVAITKNDFWEHSRQHMNVDKILTCPKCPFITEYKHHLEYHLRNHAGSKPFVCDKCEYSCVNKSMLNSHMKSHSNIYQYRCANCSYATKYCHSLKLHLRKYSHEPAMVLNSDGTPNPLPIIDVYGTRRGPKQKVASPKRSPNEAQMSATSTAFQNSFAQYMLNQQVPLPFPYPLLGGFPNPLANMFLQQSLMQMAQGAPEPIQDEYQEAAKNPETTMDVGGAEVLDLTKQDNAKRADDMAPATPQKNRRKGVAQRLDLATQSEDGGVERMDEEMSEEDSASQRNPSPVEDPPSNQGKMETDKSTAEEALPNIKVDTYCCYYCGMGFANLAMYTVHMGYHGYEKPFTCNMCGEQCQDRIEFFIHIARTAHL